jgi:hypothetical protein
MKKVLVFTILLLSFYAIQAQKPISDANAEKRTVGSFHGIEVSTGITLVLIKGETEDLAVSAATSEFRDRIVTKVEDGLLKIYYDKKLGAINRKDEPKRLKAYVSCKNLDKLYVTTGAEVEIKEILSFPSLEIKANTGATIKGQVDITDLRITQSTGSRITLSGKAGKLDVSGDTGSKFMGEDLATNDCQAEVGTGAQIYIKVQKELNARANTGGFIKYKGEGGIRNIKTNTGGYVSRI